MVNNSRPTCNSIDEYHALFPESVQQQLQILRHTIKAAAPNATEIISYQMPAFKQKSMLVYYAAYKKHIGFYPTSKPIEVFKEALKPYKTSKGAIQFPLYEPLPVDLITQIVQFRCASDEATSTK